MALAPVVILYATSSVTLGGEAAEVVYSGSAPTLNSGFFRVNLRLPPDLMTGGQFVVVKVRARTSVPITISIQ
jgi:uncharacterized protein (TIGR03437 family)